MPTITPATVRGIVHSDIGCFRDLYDAYYSYLCGMAVSYVHNFEAAREIAFLGVGLLSTAHARDASDLQKRALYREIMTSGVYDMAIIIRMEDGKRRYKVEKL